MVRYYKGMVTGLALGALGTVAVVAALDPRVCNRMMKRGRSLYKDCKRKLCELKDFSF
jgi:hypothetical protein